MLSEQGQIQLAHIVQYLAIHGPTACSMPPTMKGVTVTKTSVLTTIAAIVNVVGKNVGDVVIRTSARVDHGIFLRKLVFGAVRAAIHLAKIVLVQIVLAGLHRKDIIW